MRRIHAKPAIIGILVGLLVSYLALTALGVFRSGQQQQPVGSSLTGVSREPGEAPPQVLSKEARDAGGMGNEMSDELLARGLPDPNGGADPSFAGQYAGSADVSLTKLSLPAIDEKVVRTASLELQVKKGKFDAAYDRAVVTAKSVGGYVSQSKSAATGNAIASGEILMRIPSHDFETVLASLKRLGKVKAIDISSEDVSEEYVDLQSRLKNWRAQELVILDLMKKAKTISESITIQNNLSQIQMEIERITGRLNFLENRTSFSTIRLYVAEPQVIVRPDRWGVKAALRNAVQASMSIVGSLIVLAGYVLPLALLVGIGYAAYRSLLRTRKLPA